MPIKIPIIIIFPNLYLYKFLYIILVCEKFYFFYLFDYPWIKKVGLYDCTFEICFVYERKCGDMMFCNLKF